MSVTIEPDDVLRMIKNCYDPEIPVNVVDLGLIYDVKINEGNVDVKMTLTSQGCPSAAELPESVKDEVRKLEGVKDVSVEVIWDPPWTAEKMSDFAKRQLGMGSTAPPSAQIEPDVTKPIKKGNTSTNEDGTVILMNDHKMSYKVSPEVITFWGLCDGTKTVNQLADELAVQVKSDPKDVRSQITELVTKLVEGDLLST